MAWGGGGGGGGWHGGGHGGGSGLPFAGIPPEMQSGVERLLQGEPEHAPSRADFSYVNPEARPFTLTRFLRPHWLAIAGGIFLVVVETLTLQAGPLLTARAIDEGVRLKDASVVFLMGWLYAGTIAINGVATYARISWTGRLGQRLMKQLRVRVFSHIQRLSLDFFTEEKAGRIMTRMTSDIEALSELLQDGIINLAVQAFTLLFVVVVMLKLNVQLALIVLLAVVPIMTAMTLWFRLRSEQTYGRVRERIADVLANLQESLAGVRIVTAYNRQRYNTVRHIDIIGEHYDANVAATKVAAVYGPGTELVGTAGQALILLVGGWMVLDGRLTVGELTAFVLYLSAFFAPIQQLVQLYNTYQSGQAAVAKLRDLLGTSPSVSERPGAKVLPPIAGELRLESVTFGYDPDRPVLQDVNLTIAAGETFAFVGPTGAGKSTIAKLITRFYDPDQGRVLVDGHDLRDVTIESLRRQLGVVPQEAFLFAGSVRENVAFARPDATDDEVWEAVRAVGVDELVERLPQGIDSPVFERGSSLSSGERQLLALARAFLAQPRVLVLDEATSSLDLRSEAIIEHALDVILEGRTAIIIAHRLSTAMRADRIAVVADGGIVEIGSHDDLLAAGGRYAAMYATWISHHHDGAVVEAS